MNKVQEFKEIINELNKNINEEEILLKVKEIQYLSRIILFFELFMLCFYSGNNLFSGCLNLFSIYSFFYSARITYNNVSINKEELFIKYGKNYEKIMILFIWRLVDIIIFYYDSNNYALQENENVYKQAFFKFSNVVKITNVGLISFMALVYSIFIYKIK